VKVNSQQNQRENSRVFGIARSPNRVRKFATK